MSFFKNRKFDEVVENEKTDDVVNSDEVAENEDIEVKPDKFKLVTGITEERFKALYEDFKGKAQSFYEKFGRVDTDSLGELRVGVNMLQSAKGSFYAFFSREGETLEEEMLEVLEDKTFVAISLLKGVYTAQDNPRKELQFKDFEEIKEEIYEYARVCPLIFGY